MDEQVDIKIRWMGKILILSVAHGPYMERSCRSLTLQKAADRICRVVAHSLHSIYQWLVAGLSLYDSVEGILKASLWPLLLANYHWWWRSPKCYHPAWDYRNSSTAVLGLWRYWFACPSHSINESLCIAWLLWLCEAVQSLALSFRHTTEHHFTWKLTLEGGFFFI